MRKPLALLATLCLPLAACSSTATETAPTTAASQTAATAAPAPPSSTATEASQATTTLPSTTVSAATPIALADRTITISDPALGDLTFDVRTAGDPTLAEAGKTVMLLHGFPETNRSWDDVSLSLAQEGYFAVAMNQRGYSAGARPAEIEDYAATHLVDDVFGVADQLGAEQFHVVGHDWGSLVAWSVAGREEIIQAGRVQSLTAMSVGHPLAFAGAQANDGGDQADRSSYIAIFQAPNSHEQFLADDATFYRSIFGGAGYSDEQLDAYLEVLGTPEAMSAALNWYRAIDMVAVEAGQTITTPTLFLWSTGDTALGRAQAEGTADFVTGPYTFVEIPDASHWIVQEATDEVTSALLAHLAEHG